MARRDLYEVLELAKGASAAEVKKAYKRLARKHHPDLNPKDKTAEDRFKAISEAYAILSDPEKKKQYDLHGTVGPELPPGPGVNFSGFDFDASPAAGGFEDLFETFLRTAQNPQNQQPQQGKDLIFPLTVTLQEAYAGKRTRLTIHHTVTCTACHGEGRTAPAKRKPCAKCGGRGTVGISRGPFSFQRTCQACGGTGDDPGVPCNSCRGEGVMDSAERVEVTIPAGVDTGSRVRLKGKGQAGTRGAAPGDLFIETHVAPDPLFAREGPHLRTKVPVTFPEAVLGSRVEVPTMTGGAMLKIPPGTSSGQVFRLRDRGMPALRGGAPGDLFVEVTIVSPAMVDEKSKELLREFERLNPENPRTYTESQKG